MTEVDKLALFELIRELVERIEALEKKMQDIGRPAGMIKI